MAKTKTVSFGVWKTLFRDTLKAFRKVWWRVASVNIFTMLTLLIGTGILAGIGYLVFGRMIEVLIINLTSGGSLVGFVPLIGLGILWALFILVFSSMGKIASTIVLRNYLKKKKRSAFKIYFVDTWHYLVRYIVLSLHIVWYLFWPVILLMGVGTLAMTLTKTSIEAVGVFAIPFFVVIGLLFLWRAIHVAFMKSTLIHFDKKPKSTFKAMIKLVKGNWWGVFFSIISFFIIVNFVRVLFVIPENLFFAEQEVNIFALLDFFFSFLVLAPLLISFMYLFMVHLSKTKKITP